VPGIIGEPEIIDAKYGVLRFTVVLRHDSEVRKAAIAKLETVLSGIANTVTKGSLPVKDERRDLAIGSLSDSSYLKMLWTKEGDLSLRAFSLDGKSTVANGLLRLENNPEFSKQISSYCSADAYDLNHAEEKSWGVLVLGEPKDQLVDCRLYSMDLDEKTFSFYDGIKGQFDHIAGTPLDADVTVNVQDAAGETLKSGTSRISSMIPVRQIYASRGHNRARILTISQSCLNYVDIKGICDMPISSGAAYAIRITVYPGRETLNKISKSTATIKLVSSK
jgi:hypothetical protein